MRWLSTLTLLFFLLSPQADLPPDILAEVVRITDGDTIRVLYQGQEYPVRYIGANTPEVYFGLECYGREASQANKRFVEGQTVRLIRDVRERDDFGRLLRYVYVGEVFVNAELIRQGYAYAKAYPPDTRYAALFEELADLARREKAGLWMACYHWSSLPLLAK